MGREAQCTGEFGGWHGTGRLLLETDDLIFRGESRLKVPRGQITGARAEDGWLVVHHPEGVARFELGPAAERWADSIRNPRTRLDKLGIGPTSRVAILAIDDAAFLAELRARTAHVTTLAAAVDEAGVDGGAFDVIVFAADAPDALGTLPALKSRMVPDGGIWVVSPKGRPEIGHEVVVAAAKRCGLIDVKSARFSDTHAALKLVIPKAERARFKP